VGSRCKQHSLASLHGALKTPHPQRPLNFVVIALCRLSSRIMSVLNHNVVFSPSRILGRAPACNFTAALSAARLCFIFAAYVCFSAARPLRSVTGILSLRPIYRDALL